jgi:hypothetical protein
VNFSVNRGYVIFVIGVLLFGVLTAPFKVTCPLDKGTGVITGTTGMKVINVEGNLVNSRSFEMACATIWNEFTYDVKVSLMNEAKTPGFGTIMVKFYDPSAVGKVYSDYSAAIQEKSIEAEALEETALILTVEMSTGGAFITPVLSQRATKLIIFAIPPETTKTIEETVTIWGWEWQEQTHTLTAGLVEQTACPYCQRTGKLPITEWLKIKAGVY